MYKSLIVKLFLIFVLCLPIRLIAQQNLFNIPSGDITPAQKVFYQHQLNFYSSGFESKSHVVAGMGKGWDGGINVIGIAAQYRPNWMFKPNSNPANGSLGPQVLGSLQKQFTVNEYLDVNIGTQMGINIAGRASDIRYSMYAYLLGVYHFGKHNRIVVGAYGANPEFIGQGNAVGMMLGYEIKLSKRFYLMGDWKSGRNEGSVAVIGGMAVLSKRVQICAGWQIPNPVAPKPMGFVFELNLLGWNYY